MTLQEILKAKGMSDEDIQSTIGEMKQNKIFTSSEENLDVRYGKLKTDHEALTQKMTESDKLIAELQKASKDNETVQAQIAEYQKKIQDMETELQQTKLDSAIKVALLGEKALDVDYLMFKMKEKGEIKLDDKGEIKGLEDILSGLKTQFPSQFETSASSKAVNEHKLNESDEPHSHSEGVTKEDFAKMGYQARLKLKQENPDAYAQMTGKAEGSPAQ